MNKWTFSWIAMLLIIVGIFLWRAHAEDNHVRILDDVSAADVDVPVVNHKLIFPEDDPNTFCKQCPHPKEDELVFCTHGDDSNSIVWTAGTAPLYVVNGGTPIVWATDAFDITIDPNDLLLDFTFDDWTSIDLSIVTETGGELRMSFKGNVLEITGNADILKKD